ncbi:hypothetical protein HCN44_007078 [Aphidius gifuensis]|uniref:E3 ubiquitin-protein ligase RNF10 n=1 Tax=Aphidius gifuensis TaxID=684658 RepID=A0A834XK99_APHGI|nr:RING finger protein 10 [Aphidius gifuensis]KAF7988768.1 hypothetical protein HCN44_007078 [Aphidius gifuensis]
MEKKPTKYNQSSSSKVTATESKKNQDGVSGKNFPKGSKRREPPPSAKIETSRKSNMQKTRNSDKRPKPKGQYYACPKENTKIIHDETAEFGSVMVPGSKKQNLNHLLNFHYEPREIQGGSSGRRNYDRSSNYNRWVPSVQRQKYNKELFLQANCQFVVTANGNYSVNLLDPDTLVDWTLIEQIKLHTTENLSCPICLGPPVAGKMTKCGHVYCWPCILHYLSLSDKNWRKCPICYVPVDKLDLKSVVEITEYPLNIGDSVNLRLMRRKRGSLLAMPVQEIDTLDPTNFINVADHNNQIFSKLLIANNDDVNDIIQNEKYELKRELNEDPHSPESCFIEQALNELSEREELISKTSKNNCHIDKSTIQNNDIIDDDNNTNDMEKFFYFYQSDDGQHVYLHAMNVKMLELQFGSLKNSPTIITGKLLEKESSNFTEDMRKRLRYLSHLPLTCSFDVAEIELTTPLISDDIMSFFTPQIMAREKRRKRRDKDEKKREKKINNEENKKMGKFPTPNVHIESHKHFPQWQTDTTSSSMDIPSPPESLTTLSLASSPTRSAFGDHESIDDYVTYSSNNDQGGPSFAQMLLNKNSNHTNFCSWPSMNRHGHSNADTTNKQHNKNTTIDDNECGAAPSYSQSFGDVLAQALEASVTLDDSQSSKIKTKKKKRGKQTLLFTTGMSRAD